jgi:hypothetical protein
MPNIGGHYSAAPNAPSGSGCWRPYKRGVHRDPREFKRWSWIVVVLVVAVLVIGSQVVPHGSPSEATEAREVCEPYWNHPAEHPLLADTCR